MKPNHAYYLGFTNWQFAKDEYFQEYVLKNDLSAKDFWDRHMQLYPEAAEHIMSARKIILELHGNRHNNQFLSYEEKKILKENIYQKLMLESTEGKSPIRTRGKYLHIVAVAASVLVLIIMITRFLTISPSKPAMLVERTGTGEKKDLLLADGTSVILNPNSVIRYSRNFLKHATREVFLSGNAFFRVKNYESKQFVVQAGDLTVSVYGTDFNVNARTKMAEVVLITGKVALALKGEKPRSSFMQPGERWTVDRIKGQFLKSKVNSRLYAAWTEGKWIFNKTSLAEIAILIKEYYGVDLTFEKPRDGGLTMSGVIPVSGIDRLIPVIEETLGIEIHYSNNNLIVH